MFGSQLDFVARMAAAKVTRGEIYWVNGADGSDAATGRADDPLATITKAIDLCTDRADDTIIVMRDTHDSEATFPISIDKRDIHIFGWDEPTRPGADKHYITGGGAAVFEIAAGNVEIAGFDFASTNSYPAIQFDTHHWNACIHDNMFGRRGALQDGIVIDTTLDCSYISIYDNVFEDQIARDGIRFIGSSTQGCVGFPGHGNIFREVTEVGIHAIGASHLAGIYDNVFALTASFSEGDAISMEGAGSEGCIIDGNRCMYRVETGWSNNPYFEEGNNHWGRNWKGIATLAYPA